jgi:hypothetical protein
MLTDLEPHQQCAAIVMRLEGAAREIARMMTPQEMFLGGMCNGVQDDPATLLLGALQARFASLEKESRLACTTEVLDFARRPGETINALLARYETVRQRAAVEGQFGMNIEGCALQVLRLWHPVATSLRATTALPGEASTDISAVSRLVRTASPLWSHIRRRAGQHSCCAELTHAPGSNWCLLRTNRIGSQR